MRGYEIGKHGQACDHWLTIDLATPCQLTATSLFLGSDALYINMSCRQLFKLDILEAMRENTFEDTTVLEGSLANALAYDLGENSRVDVHSVC